jgi:uncharacterized iron-regulated membrane protein
MADHPEAHQSTTADKTSALVASGLVVLAILGVVTVFSDAIGAAWSPNATASAAGATSTATPAAQATTEPAPSTPAAAPTPAGTGGSS